MLKTYKAPAITDVSYDTAEIETDKNEFLGLVPFLAALTSGPVVATPAPMLASKKFDDKYYHNTLCIEAIGKID